MLHIGCHLSVSKGFLHMGEEALSLGADTFQFFTRNPRGGSAKALDIEDNPARGEVDGQSAVAHSGREHGPPGISRLA